MRIHRSCLEHNQSLIVFENDKGIWAQGCKQCGEEDTPYTPKISAKEVMAGAGIQQAYLGCNLADFKQIDSKIDDWLNSYYSNASKGIGMLINGSVGVGKTHLLSAMVAHLADKTLRKIKYVRGGDVLDGAYRKAGLLIIDDIGMAVRGNVAEKENRRIELFNLIDDRYGNNLPTIATSNMHIAELAEHIGVQVVDRLGQGGYIIKIDGKSCR